METVDQTKGQLVIQNMAQLVAFIAALRTWRIDRPLLFAWKPYRAKRSVPQNALLHAWIGEISKHLVARGRVDCSPPWVKEMLKNKYLGWELVDFTDVETGEVTTKEVLKKSSELDTGDMHRFLNCIEVWALDYLGLPLASPENSEYMRIKRAAGEAV